MSFPLVPSDPWLSNIPPVDVDLFESDGCFGRFTIGRTIGLGQYSAIRKCHDPLDPSKRPLAVKIVRKDLQSSADCLQCAEKELGIMKVLQSASEHNNILSMVSAWHGKNNLYIVIERAQSDLYEFLEEFRDVMDRNVGGFIISSIASGLQHLQTLNISHRDMKPENVLIDITKNNIHVRLCGFSSCTVAPMGVMVESRGQSSPGFFAPETILNKSHCPYKADIFSLGCIALEIILKEEEFSSLWLSAYDSTTRDHLCTYRSRMLRVIPQVQTLISNSVQSSVDIGFLSSYTGRRRKSCTVRLENFLIETIQECLNFIPRKRPTLDAVIVCDIRPNSDQVAAVYTLLQGKRSCSRNSNRSNCSLSDSEGLSLGCQQDIKHASLQSTSAGSDCGTCLFGCSMSSSFSSISFPTPSDQQTLPRAYAVPLSANLEVQSPSENYYASDESLSASCLSSNSTLSSSLVNLSLDPSTRKFNYYETPHGIYISSSSNISDLSSDQNSPTQSELDATSNMWNQDYFNDDTSDQSSPLSRQLTQWSEVQSAKCESAIRAYVKKQNQRCDNLSDSSIKSNIISVKTKYTRTESELPSVCSVKLPMLSLGCSREAHCPSVLSPQKMGVKVKKCLSNVSSTLPSRKLRCRKQSL